MLLPFGALKDLRQWSATRVGGDSTGYISRKTHNGETSATKHAVCFIIAPCQSQ
jgi:hypothetical protein